MADQVVYTFKIDDFTPESMPFGRLVEYYLEIKKMLGWAENIHLVDIVESSHASAFKIDQSHRSNIDQRIMELSQGIAPAVSERAQQTVNAMLAEDETSGSFSDAVGANVIVFPGRRADRAAQLRIRGAASFIGELYHIAGTRSDAKVRISTSTYGVVFCSTTKDIAKSLRSFLFENVKVSGRGIWSKTESGKWEIDQFQITDFTPVFEGSLRQTVDRLRAMDIDWPDDPVGVIDEIEERNGSAR